MFQSTKQFFNGDPYDWYMRSWHCDPSRDPFHEATDDRGLTRCPHKTHMSSSQKKEFHHPMWSFLPTIIFQPVEIGDANNTSYHEKIVDG